MANSIKAFMRKRAKEEEVVNVWAPESFVDDNGERVVMKVKRLSNANINKIYDKYHYEKYAKDAEGNFIFNKAGKLVKEDYSDSKGYLNELIVNALVFPDLHDEELRNYYDCIDVLEMPEKVFSCKGEYKYVSDIVVALAGTLSGEEVDCIIKEAKN